MHLSTVKVPIEFGLDWPWCSVLFLISNLFILPKFASHYSFTSVCIYSVSPIYRGRVYRGIGYIAVACWTPFFWRPRARYFLRNRGNTLDPIRGRQFFAKSAHRDSLCSRFAGDNFSQNQLWPTCQCGLEHMLCDGQPSSAEHWHLHCIAE